MTKVGETELKLKSTYAVETCTCFRSPNVYRIGFNVYEIGFNVYEMGLNVYELVLPRTHFKCVHGLVLVGRKLLISLVSFTLTRFEAKQLVFFNFVTLRIKYLLILQKQLLF